MPIGALAASAAMIVPEFVDALSKTCNGFVPTVVTNMRQSLPGLAEITVLAAVPAEIAVVTAPPLVGSTICMPRRFALNVIAISPVSGCAPHHYAPHHHHASPDSESRWSG